MANNWTNQDVYEIVNELVYQTMGADANLNVFDSTSFVAVGEKLKSLGQETIYNALTMMFTKTIFASRPYEGKFKVITEENRLWGDAVRKISYLHSDLIETMADNTNLAQPLGKGKSSDPFEQIPTKAVETCFIGKNEISKGITTYTRTQLNVVFSNESEFAQFITGQGVQFRNELEKAFETERRGTMLNYAAALYANNLVVDFAEMYNRAYSQSYTREELTTTHLQSFFAFIIAQIEIISDFFTEYSVKNHISIGGYDLIPRHTPKESQRMIFYNPFFKLASKLVLPNTFNYEMLELGGYETLNFWQNENIPTSILVKPRYIDSTGNAIEGDEVSIPYVLGMLYDKDAVGWYKIDESTDTIYNPRGKYFSTWYTAQSKPWNDLTENGVLFVIGEGGTPKADTTLSPYEGEVFGKNTSDLQDNIVITGNKITGKLIKNEGWTSGPLEGEGYFLTVTVGDVPNGATNVRMGLNPSEGTGLVELDQDLTGIYKVASTTQQVLQVVYTLNGENHVTTYDLSGLELVNA